MCGLVFLENHLSGTILMFSIGVAMMFFGEVKMRWFVIGAVAVIAVVVFFVIFPDKLPSYAAKRITAWLDKDFDPFGARWQTNQSLYAIGSGGFLGQGLAILSRSTSMSLSRRMILFSPSFARSSALLEQPRLSSCLACSCGVASLSL